MKLSELGRPPGPVTDHDRAWAKLVWGWTGLDYTSVASPSYCPVRLTRTLLGPNHATPSVLIREH